jgi:small-conductance mechanosensitive channel
VGSEEAVNRPILIPNAMLFSQVVINYTARQDAAFILDEVVTRITYDTDWDEAERILLDAAREATSDIIQQTGQQPYVRSDMYDYGVYMRLRFMT